MAFQETTWLDYIPGARTAYNYLVSKAAEFYLVGTQKIPTWERVTATLAPKIQQSGDADLKTRLTAVSKQTVDLKGGWTSLETRVTDMLSKLRAVGLGDGEGLGAPVLIPVALAVALVTLVGGMYIFFGATAKNERSVRELVTRAVSAGIISTQEGARLLREGGVGGGLGALGGGLGLLAIAAAAIYFLPRSRRATA